MMSSVAAFVFVLLVTDLMFAQVGSAVGVSQAAVEAVPPWMAKASPLPAPRGETLRASTADELLAACGRVGPGGTILLADGHYRLPRVIVLTGKKNIVIRSASGDPTRVILRGKGWDSEAEGDDVLHIGHCDGVTIADLTFANCRSYGVKVEAEHAPKNIHIYNCRFQDIGVRAIKSSAGQDPDVRSCQELTEIPTDIVGQVLPSWPTFPER